MGKAFTFVRVFFLCAVVATLVGGCVFVRGVSVRPPLQTSPPPLRGETNHYGNVHNKKAEPKFCFFVCQRDLATYLNATMALVP